MSTTNTSRVASPLLALAVALVVASGALFADLEDPFRRPYGADAPWNIPVADIPLHPESTYYRDSLWNDACAARPGNFNLTFLDYTYPVYYEYHKTGEYLVDSPWGNMNGQYIPWSPDFQEPPGTDGQIILLDPATGKEWNLWQVDFDGSVVHASNANLVEPYGPETSGSYWTKEYGFPPSRGVGIQYLAMLVRPEEIHEGVIHHALSVPIINTSGEFYVAPATKLEHPDNPPGIPEGMRFALDVTEQDIQDWLDSFPPEIEQMKPFAQAVGRALRDYGWFITDTSGGAHFQFEAWVSAGNEWSALGLDTVSAGGKEYPRDLLDGLMLQNRIYTLVPSDQYPAMPPAVYFHGDPQSGDAPLAVDFTDLTGNSPTSWSWTFGDGGSSTDQNPNHTYASAGTYTVSLTAANSQGQDALTRTDYIDVTGGAPQPPVADFSGNPTSGDAPLAVSFTDLSSNSPTSWSWTFGDGGSSTAQNPSHDYTGAGDYTVSLQACNAQGCDTETKTNYISASTAPPPPVADFSGSPTSGQAPLTVSFTDLSTNTPTSWDWTFGDGGSSSAQDPSHDYTSAGDHTVSLTATNSAGSDTETKTDYISVAPPSGQVTIFSDDFEASFSGWTTSGTVDWYTGTPKNGTHGIEMIKTSSMQQTISTAGYQNITVSFYMGADSFEVSHGDHARALWYDGSSWTELIYIGPGDPEEDGQLHYLEYSLPSGANDNANFALRFEINASWQTDYTYVDDVVVEANTTGPPPAPVAEFSGSPTSGDYPLTVSFTDLSTNTPTSWDWDFGDAGSSTSQNPSHDYTSAGDYTVSLTATNAGGSDTETKTNYISVSEPPPPAPVADFSASPTSGEAPLTVNFTDASTNSPTSWSWTFGDGGSSTSQNPSHDYTSAGDYTVSLTATNAGGSDTETKTNYISVSEPPPPAPVAEFSGSPTSGDYPLTVSFTDASTNSPTSWSWDFGDGGSSTAQNPSHDYTSAGDYTVSLTATNAGGSDTETKTNYISVTSGGGPVTIFSDDFEAALSGWTTSGTVNWYTGTPKNGTHGVEMIKTSSMEQTISTVGYSSISVSFYMGADSFEPAHGDHARALWYDGSSWTELIYIGPGDPEEDGQLHYLEYSLPGAADDNPNFALRFEISGSWSTDYTYVDDVVVSSGGGGPPPAPAADFSGSPSSGDAPLTVNFTDLSTNTPTSWSWDFGDAGGSTAQNPSHGYTSAGDYTVSLTATNAGGSDTETKTNYISVTSGPSEVVVYPTSWSSWLDSTHQSGSYSDLESDDGSYMVFRCNTSTQKHAVAFQFSTSYTPADVTKITVESQLKSSRSDSPAFMCMFHHAGGGETAILDWPGQVWGTADTDFTWETTDVSTYLGSDGAMSVEWCGCYQNSNNYDVSHDVMRIRLELAQ